MGMSIIPDHVKALVHDALEECIGNLGAELPQDWHAIAIVCVTDQTGQIKSEMKASAIAGEDDTVAINLTCGVMDEILFMLRNFNPEGLCQW